MTTTYTRLAVARILLSSIASRDDDFGSTLAAIPASVALDMPEELLDQAARHQAGPTVEAVYLLPHNIMARFALGEEERP